MEWNRGQTVGHGSTATVSIAEARGSGQVFAVKSAELHQSEFLKRERRILSKLKCPQIVAYKGCDVTLENGAMFFNLFMEYTPHGTLSDAIRKRNGGLDEALVQTYARQILLGLNYLHSNGIVHCDIKSQNVLVTDEGAKIADFGCARRVGSAGVIAGTPVFMAPEVARGEEQSFPADVWALGCTVLEMTTGKAPWHDVTDPVAALYRIGFSGEVPEIPSFMTEQGKDFLRKCLTKDPNERWSASELLKHGFVQESSLVSNEINGSNSDTPTSVLDGSFWFSMSELVTNQNCSWDSAEDRIRGLGADCPTSFSGKRGWEWDDDNWITVRNNARATESNEKTGCSGTESVNVGEDSNIRVVLCERKTMTGSGMSSCNVGNNYNNYCCWSRESLLGCPCTHNVAKQKFDDDNKQNFYFDLLSSFCSFFTAVTVAKANIVLVINSCVSLGEDRSLIFLGIWKVIADYQYFTTIYKT